MKFLRDASLYGQHAKRGKFEAINETSKDMEVQMGYKQTLEKLDLRGQLIALANRIAGVKISTQLLQEKVDTLGLLRDSRKNLVDAAGSAGDRSKGPTASPNVAKSSRGLASPLARQGSIRPARASLSRENSGLAHALSTAVRGELLVLI
jgi:hypothetical protein